MIALVSWGKKIMIKFTGLLDFTVLVYMQRIITVSANNATTHSDMSWRPYFYVIKESDDTREYLDIWIWQLAATWNRTAAWHFQSSPPVSDPAPSLSPNMPSVHYEEKVSLFFPILITNTSKIYFISNFYECPKQFLPTKDPWQIVKQFSCIFEPNFNIYRQFFGMCGVLTRFSNCFIV